jgi:hypothetical protein
MLLQKAVKTHFDKVHYLKHHDSIVKTKPENDLFKLFMQRVRWASKTTSYKNTYAKILAIVVLLMNLSLVIAYCLLPIASLNWKLLFIGFLIKYVVDYVLLFQSNTYLRKGKFLVPIASSLLYPVFCSTVGLYSLFGNFTWKGRRFKK